MLQAKTVNCFLLNGVIFLGRWGAAQLPLALVLARRAAGRRSAAARGASPLLG